jgi:hypothetical protein
MGIAVTFGRRRGERAYVPRTIWIPLRSNSSFGRGNRPTRSVSRFLSTLTICETTATEFCGRPVIREERWMLPGAKAHLKLLVRGTQRTVAILLRFKLSDCTTTTGRRNPGPDPFGGGRSAHQISPWEITTPLAQEHVEQLRQRMGRCYRRSRRRLCSWPR